MTELGAFILKYWIDFAFGLIVAALGAAYKRIYSRIKEQDKIKEGVLAILHDRLFQAGRYYIRQGWITLEGIKNIEYLYNSYHALGGNGTGTEIFERIKNLPLKESEE